METCGSLTGTATGRDCSDPCLNCGAQAWSFCNVLSAPELARLKRIFTLVPARARQTIFHEGDPARHVFTVQTGFVRIAKTLHDGRRQVTGFLFPGDFLGISLDGAYACSAEAGEDSRLCRFPRHELEALLDELPKLRISLFNKATNELAAVQNHLVVLGRLQAREKLAALLVMLATRNGRELMAGDAVKLPMSRADIGDYLGLTTETVSRTLTAMQQVGLIELKTATDVVIHAPLRLQRSSQLDAA